MDETPAVSLRGPEPPKDCQNCSRLAAVRAADRAAEPRWVNGAGPPFGDETARLLIVGLAPGLKGANRTGRPFTGDYAGLLLYATLLEFGFAKGRYEARPDDGLLLIDCMISNAVRCVPPQNKPTPAEMAECRHFLAARLAALARLRAVLVLGPIAHDSTLAAFAAPPPQFPFAHGARHDVRQGLAVFDSLHCSRLNTNTGRLTAEMFRSVFAAIRSYVGNAR